MQDILELIAGAKLAGPSVPSALEDSSLPVISVTSRLRHSHHLLARAIAEGRPDVQAAAISGYAPSSVASLKRDPAFQELVAHYQSQVDDIFAAVQDRLGALGLSFLDELQHRLEENPADFKVGQLLAMATALLDRSVAPSKGQKGLPQPTGPSAISVNIQFAEGPPATPTIELKAAG
jgi:hypothetical protein